MGSSGFARRYSRNHCCFLFLRLLRCFSSPGSLPWLMDWARNDGGLLRRVSPFRHLRIVGYLLLPEAFRSLSRLSSALSAKASTICSFLHDQLPDASHPAHRHSVAGVGSGPIFSVRFLRTSWLMFLHYLGCLVPPGCLAPGRFLDISSFLVCGFQGTCDNQRLPRLLRSPPRLSNGEYEIRTRDLLLARQALSQLS